MCPFTGAINMFFGIYNRSQVSVYRIIGPLVKTVISLVFFLWDIGKQYSLRCDPAKRNTPFRAILFALRNFIRTLKKKKKKNGNRS